MHSISLLALKIAPKKKLDCASTVTLPVPFVLQPTPTVHVFLDATLVPRAVHCGPIVGVSSLNPAGNDTLNFSALPIPIYPGKNSVFPPMGTTILGTPTY